MSFMQTWVNKAVQGKNKIAGKINSSSDWIVFLWLSVFYFVYRIVTLPLFEISGDAVWKWRFLRYFYETGTWFPHTPEHHQGRWAQNMPVYFLMELFDTTAPWLGSVVPILTGFIVLFLVWRIARELTSRTGAVTAVLLTIANPVFLSESAQFLPSMPSTMYILAALYLLILCIKKPDLWFLPLLAGLSIGLAWGCKVTAVYWALGMGLFMLFNPVGKKNIVEWKRLRIGWDVVLFTLGFLLIFIPETIIINNAFDLRLGRLDMLHRHHGDNPRLVVFNLVEYIFAPFVIFLNISGKFIRSGIMASLFVLVLPLLIIQFRKKTFSPIQKIVVFTMLIAIVCHCYLVVSVFPFKHPERPLVRYFFALFCVWNIWIAAFWRCIFEIQHKYRTVFFSLYGFVGFVLLFWLCVNLISEPVINGDNLFMKIRAYKCLELHKKKNVPWLIRYEKGKLFRTKTIKCILAWESFFGDSRRLPLLQEPELRKVVEEWQKRPPVRDEKGTLYFLLWGKRPEPGQKALCVIAEDDAVVTKTLSIGKSTQK